jgi:hypothetical protein
LLINLAGKLEAKLIPWADDIAGADGNIEDRSEGAGDTEKEGGAKNGQTTTCCGFDHLLELGETIACPGGDFGAVRLLGVAGRTVGIGDIVVIACGVGGGLGAVGGE